MKNTSRRLTLRGSITRKFNAEWNDPVLGGHVVLEYANVLDLKKAWKVEGYGVWLKDYRKASPAIDLSTCSIESFLATDDGITDTGNVLMCNNPQDPRQIAWGNTMLDLGKADKVNTTKVQGVFNEAFCIDPDHIIQDELRLFTRLSGSDVEEGKLHDINYIIWLREVEITPAESIIQNIKGKSQDLS